MGIFGVIFSFMPFAFMNSTPVLMMMGKLDLSKVLMYLGIGILWIIIIELFNHLLFKFCIKRVSVQGG